MKKEYEVTDFKIKPNIVLLIAWMCTWVILIGTLKIYESAFVTLSFLLFGWTFSFAKFEVKKNDC
jgi:uncharacterized membrane protein YkgB